MRGMREGLVQTGIEEPLGSASEMPASDKGDREIIEGQRKRTPWKLPPKLSHRQRQWIVRSAVQFNLKDSASVRQRVQTAPCTCGYNAAIASECGCHRRESWESCSLAEDW